MSRRFEIALNAIAKPGIIFAATFLVPLLPTIFSSLETATSSRWSLEPTQCSATLRPAPSSATRAPAGSE